MEEYVVKHESTHSQSRPLAAANRSELSGRLASPQGGGQANSWRERTEGDLISPSSHITEATTPHCPVVEVDTLEPLPQSTRDAIEEDPDLGFRDEVPPIAPGWMVGEGEGFHGESSVSCGGVRSVREPDRIGLRCNRRGSRYTPPRGITRCNKGFIRLCFVQFSLVSGCQTRYKGEDLGDVIRHRWKRRFHDSRAPFSVPIRAFHDSPGLALDGPVARTSEFIIRP